MKNKILGLLRDKNIVGSLIQPESVKQPSQDFLNPNNINRQNSRGSRKSSKHKKLNSNNTSFDGDDEDNGRVFSEIVIEDYRRELKIQNKKVFQPNFDYRVKLQALAKLQKQIVAQNTGRDYFIFNIDHEYYSQDRTVEFHMKIAKIENNEVFFKSQMQNTNRYTVDLELSIYDEKIKDKIAKFCKEQKINYTDETSLVNYAFVIVEAQRIAIEAKVLILEIQKIKTDELLLDFHRKGLFKQAEQKRKPKHQPQKVDWKQNYDKFEKHILDKQEALQTKIYQKMKYKNLPHRIFPRYQTYEDIKMRLYTNLNNSIKLVLEESQKILKRYTRIDVYLDCIAFGRKHEHKLGRKQRNMTVDILMQKQRDLQGQLANGQQGKRPSNAMYNRDRGNTFDYYNHYRVTTVGQENTPDRSSAELIKKQGQFLNTPSPDKMLGRMASNDSNLNIHNNLRASDKKRSFMNNLQSSAENLNMSSRMVFKESPDGKGMMGQNGPDKRYMADEYEKIDKSNQKAKFIQSKEANTLDALIKSYCEAK
eukprot:403373932